MTAVARHFFAPRVLWRIAVTLLAIALLRLGQRVPLPNVDAPAAPGGVLDLVSGGGIGRLSVCALGVWPYLIARPVTAALIGAIPRLRSLAEAGIAGTRRLNRLLWAVAVLLGLGLSTVVVAVAAGGGFGARALDSTAFGPLALMAAVLGAGSVAMLPLAWAVNRFGFGNGHLILALAPLLAGFTGRFGAVLREDGPAVFAAIVIAVLAAIAVRAGVSQAQRRIPIQYAKRMIGRRVHGGGPTYLPIPLVSGGDKALLWVSLPLLAPALIWPGWRAGSPWYVAAFAVLVWVATLFVTVGARDWSGEVRRLERTGAFVPGIQPGAPTERYLAYVRDRLSLAGATLWTLGAALPLVTAALLGADPGLFLLPVTVFHIVEIAMTTARQIDTRVRMRAYAGVLR
ncbi:hypothetical protein [Actinorhabdospora filicis]|nr:hypothetical protein [Actinorhabdospora filicis]